jgi:hypothetical protein
MLNHNLISALTKHDFEVLVDRETPQRRHYKCVSRCSRYVLVWHIEFQPGVYGKDVVQGLAVDDLKDPSDMMSDHFTSKFPRTIKDCLYYLGVK